MSDATAPTQPDVDHVSLTGTGSMQGKSIDVSVSCELMHNQLPGSAIEPTTDIAVVQDSKGNPVIFTIGSDRTFRCIKSDAGSATGWTPVDLSTAFTGYSGAATFDVSEDLKGNITIAFALVRAGGTATDLFIAPMLTSDFSQAVWADLSKTAIKVANVDPGFTANKIRMGTSDDGQAPFVTIVGTLGSQQIYYQIVHPNDPAARLEFPENVPSDPNAMMDLAVGFLHGQRGVWYLYSVGQTETLECKTLATSDEGSLTYDFSPGYRTIPAAARYNCIATPTGTDTDPFSISSDVYVGTDSGISVFVGGRIEKLQTVTDKIKDVHQIIVRQDAHSIAVWAMCSPYYLYYIYGKKVGSTYQWCAPVLFSQTTVHLAPLRLRTRLTNEIFVVNTDLSVGHHWQDPASTLWQQRVIKAPKSDYLFDLTTFTTRIHVDDSDGNPIGGENLAITASEWTYVTANGLVYSLDHDTPASIPTDPTGALTIISLASDIAVPILHIQSGLFGETLNIYPNGKISNGLAAIKTGDDLKNARTASGPLVDPATNADTLDGVASNLTQLTGASSQYASGTRPSGSTFTAVENGVKHTGVLSVAHLPQSFAVGMQLQGGVWQPHPSPAVALVSLGGVLGDLESFAGDVLHYIETAFVDGIKLVEQGVTYLQDGVNFVIKKVEDGLMFVLNLAGKVFNVLLKTLGAVFKALNWILKLIGIDLTKILAWLGHLFGWDDIWDTHKIIASMMRSGLDYAADRAVAEIEPVRATLKSGFGAVKTEIHKLVLPADVAAIQPKAIVNAQRQTPAGTANRSAPAGFSNYQLQHGGMLQSTAAPMPAPTMNPFEAFLNDVVLPVIDVLLNDLNKDLEDFKRALTDPTHTLDNLRQLAVDLIDTIIDPIAAFADGMLKFVEDMIGIVKRAVEDEFEIPFLSSFYEFVSDLLGDEEQFTFINGVALLVAIPLVEVCKLVTGKAPFANSSYGLDSPDFFYKLRGVASQPQPQLVAAAAQPAFKAASLSSAAADTDDDPPSAAEQRAREYAKFGGLIGAGAGGIEAIGRLLNWASEQQEDPEKQPLNGGAAAATGLLRTELGTMQKFLICTIIPKIACTIPMRDKKQSDASYGLMVTSYLLIILQNISEVVIKNTKVNGGLAAAANAVTFAFLMAADGLDKPPVLTWASDVTNNISGVLQGLGDGFNSTPVQIIGYVGGMAGAGMVVAHALTMEEGTILRSINVGG